MGSAWSSSARGSMRPQLEALRDRLNLQNDMLLAPATSDVAAWMRSMDIFVLPSTSESFSNALLEAMACGCCVIGSRVGGTPELICDQASGLLFDSGDLDGLVAWSERKWSATTSCATVSATRQPNGPRLSSNRVRLKRTEAPYTSLL